jgi:serine/threonine-protein kinase
MRAAITWCSTRTRTAGPTPTGIAAIKTSPFRGLGLKLFLAIVVVVALTLGGALALIRLRASQAADAAIDRGLGATQSAVQDGLAGRSHTLQQSARILAQVPSYISRIDEGLRAENRSDLLDAADEFRAQGEAAWALITDQGGVLQASTRDRDASGEEMGEGKLVGDALGGTPAEGIWIESTRGGDSLFQAVAVPIKPPGAGVPVSGVLILGIPLDAALAARLKRQTNSEIVFISLDTLNRPALAVSTLAPDVLAQAMGELQSATGLADTGSARLQLHAGGLTWIGASGPLRTAGGSVIWAYAGLRAREAELAPFTALQRSILFAFLGALAIALVISLVLARQIARPIRQLVGVTREVAEGRYSGKVDIKSKDEIGELAGAFQRMLSELEEKRRLVEFLGGSARTTPVRPSQANTISSAETMATASRLGVGALLANRYEIRQQLGAGGMGVVYRAFDRELQESVAIKTLKPDLVGDATLLERFKQEIRLARKISHPNVVRTHDLGDHEGTYFITLEFVEGTSLDELLKRRGALPLSVTLTIGRQLLRALDVAHGQGVVHRDIKPPNLVVDAQGFLKVMDFGIARLVEGRGPNGAALTAEGSIIGTPEDLAPEQLMGQPVDGRADLYATGAVLYECITGRRLVEGSSFATLLLKAVQEPAPDVRALAPKTPESLARAIRTALEKKPEDRFQSAEAFAEALDRVRE